MATLRVKRLANGDLEIQREAKDGELKPAAEKVRGKELQESRLKQITEDLLQTESVVVYYE